MKKFKQYIIKEIKKLTEREYDAPTEILDTLQNRLKMFPLNRYISHLKAVNSIPPSYEINLHNGETFLIIYEDFSLLAKIGSKEYFLNDPDEKNYCIQHINRLLTGPKSKPEEEEIEDAEGSTPAGGGMKPPTIPLPTKPATPPPTPTPTPASPEEPEA